MHMGGALEIHWYSTCSKQMYQLGNGPHFQGLTPTNVSFSLRQSLTRRPDWSRGQLALYVACHSPASILGHLCLNRTLLSLLKPGRRACSNAYWPLNVSTWKWHLSLWLTVWGPKRIYLANNLGERRGVTVTEVEGTRNIYHNKLWARSEMAFSIQSCTFHLSKKKKKLF